MGRRGDWQKTPRLMERLLAAVICIGSSSHSKR